MHNEQVIRYDLHLFGVHGCVHTFTPVGPPARLWETYIQIAVIQEDVVRFQHTKIILTTGVLAFMKPSHQADFDAVTESLKRGADPLQGF